MAQSFLEGFGARQLGRQQVQAIRLDDYCDSEGIDTIDFLKLDVQGWEIHCLSGASSLLRQGRIRCIYSEVNFVKLYEQQVYYEDVASCLRTSGYRLFNLYALSFNKDGQLCWADALFIPS